MIDKLKCLVFGHKWCFWGVCDDVEAIEFTKCMRCGKYKDDGKARHESYING